VMSIAIRNVPTYHKLHFSNFLFGIYSKDAWLMAEGISPSFLETWSRTWIALNDKIAHICLLIARLNKLGSSSQFINLPSVMLIFGEWFVVIVIDTWDAQTHVVIICCMQGLPWFGASEEVVISSCMLQIKLKPCVELGPLLACHAFCLLMWLSRVLQAWNLFGNIVLCLGWSSHLQFGISSVAKLHDPTLTHLFSFDELVSCNIVHHIVFKMLTQFEWRNITLLTNSYKWKFFWYLSPRSGKKLYSLSFFHLPKLFRV
jgi:hypothetical protein